MAYETESRHMARELAATHGKLRKVRILTHFPDFNIDFKFDDGVVVRSGKRTGVLDIHMLSFGYYGTGPIMSHAFLEELGYDLLYSQVTSLRAPVVLFKRSNRIIARKRPSAEGGFLYRLFGYLPSEVDLTLQKEFAEAVEKGDSRLTEELIDGFYPHDSDFTDFNEATIRNAVSGEHSQIIHLLLKAGASRNTTLAVAAEEGLISIVELLIAEGVDLSATYEHGDTPLILAARNGHDEVLKILIASFPDISSEQLVAAVVEGGGHSKIVETISTALGSKLKKSDANYGLHRAAQKGNLELAKLFLAAGADINQPIAEDEAYTVLQSAIISENVHLVRLLVEKGANIHARDKWKRTTLFHAGASKIKIVQTLLDAGADVNTPNPDGRTPLWNAVRYRKVAVARLLLEHGAKVRTKRYSDGPSILQIAKDHDIKELMDLLRTVGNVKL